MSTIISLPNAVYLDAQEMVHVTLAVREIGGSIQVGSARLGLRWVKGGCLGYLFGMLVNFESL